MKKFLKFLAYGFLGLVALIAILAGAVYLRSNHRLGQTFPLKSETLKVPDNLDAAISRGRHLAMTRGCVDCHGLDLGGNKVVDDPAMGRLYGPNLTRGQGGVTTHYNDADWARSIRHGVAPSGRGLFLMPSADYAEFTADDMSDLVAFLKSVPAVDRESVPLKIGPVARALMLAGKIKLAAEIIDHEKLEPAVVKPAVTVAYGRYVAAGCTGCHGANFSGGKIDIGPPNWPPAANLTPDASGRLAHWQEADFIRALREARRPDGTQINPVMPAAFGGMNDTELKALWAYLQTVKPVPTGQR